MRTLLLALALASLGAPSALAELIYLKDGNVVVGSIVGATADAFDVQLSGGKTTIKKSSIARVDYAQESTTPPPERPARSATLGRGELLVLAGFGGGIPLKSQGFSRAAKADLASNVEVVHQVDEHWGLGLSLDAPGFATNYPSDDNFNRKSEVQAAGLELVARVVGMPQSMISPVLNFGAGFDSYYQIIETTSKTTGALSETHGTVGGLAVVAGAGVQALFKSRPRLIAQLMTRWHYFQADNKKFGIDGAQAISIVASIGCRF